MMQIFWRVFQVAITASFILWYDTTYPDKKDHFLFAEIIIGSVLAWVVTVLIVKSHDLLRLIRSRLTGSRDQGARERGSLSGQARTHVRRAARVISR